MNHRRTALPGRPSHALAAALLGTALLAGCEQQANGPAADPGQKEAAADKTGGNAAAPVKLDIASWEEVQKYVADHKGKVVVLDLWSTSCTPCIKELPGLVKLHQDHPEDVVCLTVNVDYIGLADEPPESHREAAAKILAEKGATFQNFLSSTSDSDLYAKLDVAAVPVVYVYGRDGKLARRFDNEKDEYGKEGFSYEDHIAPLVKELVAAKGT